MRKAESGSWTRLDIPPTPVKNGGGGEGAASKTEPESKVRLSFVRHNTHIPPKKLVIPIGRAVDPDLHRSAFICHTGSGSAY